ncbi:MAG: putative selenate ABC transporter substrate-binding protein [Tildeniella nuda ZEHNDER 1965/U140]|jgi:phosphonate transport system substrate-binding protein|nr:putative selenate ABC transporter substrate-binding protein [Tildeniella nuda ZEHNDER 1965/U140]
MKRNWTIAFAMLLLSGLSVACSPQPPAANAPEAAKNAATKAVFTIGAIPDQDPEQLQRLYAKLSTYLQQELNVPVTYKPVTDYTAAVTAFKIGDLQMVWFGGLTGVQARLQVPGAEAIAQREIDARFHSIFIANKNSGLTPITNQKGLTALKGKTFTFGSESSTSGRLMPQYFLQQANVKLTDFKGEVGFSKNHDATLKLVQAGTYNAGVLNEKIWLSRLQEGKVDTNKVEVIWRTPSYYDYHWVINPAVKQQFGGDFEEKVRSALLKLNPAVPEQKEILDLFNATKFVPTQNSNYAQIEQVGREIGKIK